MTKFKVSAPRAGNAGVELSVWVDYLDEIVAGGRIVPTIG